MRYPQDTLDKRAIEHAILEVQNATLSHVNVYLNLYILVVGVKPDTSVKC